jgi:hypothetical protein
VTLWHTHSQPGTSLTYCTKLLSRMWTVHHEFMILWSTCNQAHCDIYCACGETPCCYRFMATICTSSGFHKWRVSPQNNACMTMSYRASNPMMEIRCSAVSTRGWGCASKMIDSCVARQDIYLAIWVQLKPFRRGNLLEVPKSECA